VAPASLRLEAIIDATEQTRNAERRNRRQATVLDFAGDGLLVAVALQTVLAAAWLIS
jgi:hypothetical protein